jgi:hypothetical protein
VSGFRYLVALEIGFVLPPNMQHVSSITPPIG